MMKALMAEPRFDYIGDADKAFITAFDTAMEALGYSYGGEIGSGYCWGPYMIIYAKAGIKQKKVVARIYLREGGIVLRLYFSKIDGQRAYIEAAPDYVREPFVSDHAACNHCKDMGGGLCKFRKTYTLFDKTYEKCNGVAFEYPQPALDRLDGYLGLLEAFYAPRRGRAG